MEDNQENSGSNILSQERSESPSILQGSPEYSIIHDDIPLTQSNRDHEPYSDNAQFHIHAPVLDDASNVSSDQRPFDDQTDSSTSSQSNEITITHALRGNSSLNFVNCLNNDNSIRSGNPLISLIDEEPPAEVRKMSSSTVDNENDGETCPICLDIWGNSGEHRLVALKCGHLFGLQCVERWLRAQPVPVRTCPTCKCKATLKDIRSIYAKRLVAVDTTQITALQKQVEILQTEKNRTQLELQKLAIAHRVCEQQIQVLRSTYLKQVTNDKPQRKSWRCGMEKNLEICKNGGCRVVTYNCRTYELYVSLKSHGNLFPGYGIRKVNCIDYKLGQFVHLHMKPIRDITYSQPRDLLLSVGLDSAVRVVERGVPNATIQCGVPLWSVSWDYLRDNEFYVGGVGGVIHQYDIRNQSSYIQRLTGTSDLSPVVSLCSTEYGLLSCQLNSCWLWVANRRQWEPRALPVDGPFMSLCYDNESHRAMLSSRPVGNERSRLSICKLNSDISSGEILFDIEQTHTGSNRSTVMSKSAWVKAPGASWVAAYSESESSLVLHGIDGAKTVCLPSAEPVLDVCAAQINNDAFLAALSASKLRLYKAVPVN